PSPPQSSSLVEVQTDEIGNKLYAASGIWFQWFISLITRIQLSAFLQKKVTLPLPSNASIVSTQIPRDTASAGTYRVSIFAQVRAVAATTSSLIVTISWLSNGQTMTQATAAMTGNTLSTQLNQAFTINVDQSSPISYSTT